MKTRSSLAALFAAVFLLIAGGALSNLLTPLRAKIVGFPEIAIGLLGSFYFCGMLAGALVAPQLAPRLGAARAFTIMAAAGAVFVALMPMTFSPWAWLILRGALGFAFAGLYAVIESWINATATNANRGALYGLYQIVAFAASTAGQLTLAVAPATGWTAFAIGAALFALSIAPLWASRASPPAEPRASRLNLIWLTRLSPVGALGALLVGAANGAYTALGAVYALDVGLTPHTAPWFAAAVTLGSALGVYPAGRLSDRIDRRAVIAAMAGVGSLIEIALWLRLGGAASLIALGFGVGVATFALYTLTTSHANDRVEAEQTVLVSAGLLFLYCIGAIVAPICAAALMRLFGPGALFAQNAAIHALLAIFAIAQARFFLTAPTENATSGCARR